jgi:predicted deacylase
LDYQALRDRLGELAYIYPDVMRLTTAEDEFGISHEVSCEDADRCQVDIVYLKNKGPPKNTVYFSGALHGDEVIGPNSVYYFIEYILQNMEILGTTQLIITPMTNAVGYFYHEREERLSMSAARHYGVKSVDINRDFPYNTDKCLNSIAARVVYKILTSHEIISTLTFHGGCNVIGYPWGSYNHSYKLGGKKY